jgi:hypothetical protein
VRVSEVQHIKDKTGTVYLAGLTVEVVILDIREVYGNLQYLVTPVSGSDSVWVSAARVMIVEGVKK